MSYVVVQPAPSNNLLQRPGQHKATAAGEDMLCIGKSRARVLKCRRAVAEQGL